MPIIGALAIAIAPNVAANQSYARDYIEQHYQWDEKEFNCLNTLWKYESGWNQYAVNRKSGAWGIPQALPGKKMASHGADWQTNPQTQIRWGLAYIENRYQTPCNAYAHFKRKNWY